MKTTKITHNAQTRAQFHANRLHVLWLTKMTAEELYSFQIHLAVDWLRHHTGESDEMVRELIANPTLADWWQNAWSRRDEQYLPTLFNATEASRRTGYRSMHLEALNSLIEPPYSFLAESYARAMGRAIDNLVNAPCYEVEI